MSQIQKSISLNEKKWKQIDLLRGDIPRSRYISKIIAEGLKESEVNI